MIEEVETDQRIYVRCPQGHVIELAYRVEHDIVRYSVNEDGMVDDASAEETGEVTEQSEWWVFCKECDQRYEAEESADTGLLVVGKAYAAPVPVETVEEAGALYVVTDGNGLVLESADGLFYALTADETRRFLLELAHEGLGDFRPNVYRLERMKNGEFCTDLARLREESETA